MTNRVSTAREALFAELLGDVKDLLDRIDVLLPTLNTAREGMATTANALVAGIKPFQTVVTDFLKDESDRVRTHIIECANTSGSKAVDHIVRRANETAAQTVEQQTRAMTRAAREIIAQEIEPQLRELTRNLKDAVERANHPWTGFLLFASTVISTSLGTIILLRMFHQLVF